jgi:hypothetical protein
MKKIKKILLTKLDLHLCLLICNLLYLASMLTLFFLLWLHEGKTP